MKIIKGCLNKNLIGRIYFKNPYKTKITVCIALFTDVKSEHVFDLRTDREMFHVFPLTTLEIPFCFKPSEISSYFCEI